MQVVTLRLDTKTHKTLAEKAKRFHVSQGEIVGILISESGDNLDARLTEARKSKLAARDAAKRLSRLSPDQLAKLMDLVE